MHLILLHGYLLQGTGSNIYVANIARAWKDQGHAVTVVCQDRQARGLSFVDEYFGEQEEIPAAPPPAGILRVIVPDIGGLLPVYVFDRYEGFTVKTIPEMSEQEIASHIEMTAAALRRVAGQGADLVLANHALFSPLIARRALEGTGVPYRVKIHGSAVEYTLVPNPELMKYAVEGLSGAEKIFVGTRYVRERVQEVFGEALSHLNLQKKLTIVPPGMDPRLFDLPNGFAENQRRFLQKVHRQIAENPAGRRRHPLPPAAGLISEELNRRLQELADSYDQRTVDADLPEKWQELREDEPVILYLGKFIPAKGVGEVMLTIPEVLRRMPSVRFIFVGFGSYREHLEGMIHSLQTGNIDAFSAYARAGDFTDVEDTRRWFRPLSQEEVRRITVTGLLDHSLLRELLPLASLTLVPSKWPEAFGMVAVEAMAAGVLPLCNYHAGLRDVVDEVRNSAPELGDLIRINRDRFVEELPDKIETALRYLYPGGFADSRWRKEVGKRLREISVKNFSWEGIARRLL